MASPHLLSKSDFKIAQSCPTKLYYLKSGYPTTLEEDEYLELLAEGGYIVGKMAQLLHPDGIEIKTDRGTQFAVEETLSYLKQERVTLFEPAFLSDQKLVRIDILVKDGDRFDLIEVKAKSFDSVKDQEARQNGNTYFDSDKREWNPYLDDVTYQTVVLEEIFPQARITPYLLLPDKSKRTQSEGLAGWFQIQERLISSSGFRSFDVSFTGDLEALRKDDILTLVNVSDQVQSRKAAVQADIQQLLASLSEGLTKIATPISKECKNCEFNKMGDPKNGYLECWGELAKPDPHIFDLWRGGAIGGPKKPFLNDLIRERKTSLYDFPEERLTGKNGRRQKIQITYTKSNREWIDPALKDKLEAFSYPLHFIDFETSKMAIPYAKGMRPYEQIAFQWSCHTIHSPGDEPIHQDWVNCEDLFPNFEFARSLKSQIGTAGTVFMWSHHENSVLKDIYHQLEIYGLNDPDLKSWLEGIARIHQGEEYKIIDMNKLAEQHYFHPQTKGKTTIKAVLPAIWNHNPYLHSLPFLKKYVRIDEGVIANPYDTLEKIDIAGRPEVIQDGTGAMRAYQDMLFGLNKHNALIRKKRADLLRQYCELDTAAMVVVWLHWNRKLSQTG